MPTSKPSQLKLHRMRRHGSDAPGKRGAEAPTAQKATAILQGRLGSTRLPGKVMLDLAGKPVMQHVYERILRCRNIDRIIVATSTDAKDDPIALLFGGLGVTVFRGSESDPLDRYYQAATWYGLSHIVRIMADCPLVDPVVVDEVIAVHFDGGHDFSMLSGSFPVGLDTTVYAYDALMRCWQEANRLSEREHIFPYITHHPELFDIGTLEKNWGASQLRWVMDHEVDYRFVTSVYDALYTPGKVFLSPDVLALLDAHPQLASLNAGIPRDEGIREAIRKEQAAMASRAASTG